MSFIKGDNSAPLLLFPCTKSTLCRFAFFCNIRQRGWCINKGSSGLNKLLIWTMAVSKSTGRLAVNIFHSLLVRFVRRSRRPSIWHCGVFTLSPFAGCLYCNFLRAAGPRASLLLHFPVHLESFGAKLTFFVFTAPLISSCFVPPTAAPDIG